MELVSNSRVRVVATATPWWKPRRKPSPVTSGEPEKSRASAAFYSLIGFTFILLVAPQETFTFLSPLHLGQVSALIATGALVYTRSREHRKILAQSSSVAISIALACWAVFTIPFSMWPGGSLDLFTSLYIKAIIVFLLLGTVIDSTLKLRQMATALTLFALPLSATALLHFADHDVITGVQGLDRIVGYSAGLAKNPNDLALILNLILPVTISLFLITKGGGKRFLLAIAIALDAGAVIATFSRAGFLTLAAVFIGFTWKLRHRKERVFVWAAWGVALLGLLLLPAGYLGHLGTITNISADSTGSAQERSRDMLTALGLIGQHPIFGAGLGQNVLALNASRGATWRMVHNVYLQYATDLGIPGLLLFLLLFKSCWSGLALALKKLRGDATRLDLFNLGEGIQLSLVGFGLAAFFHPAGYNFFFFFFAGLAVAVRGIAIPAVGRT